MITDLSISYDPDNGYLLTLGDFNAEGFHNGYSLFQALKTAYKENLPDNETNVRSPFIPREFHEFLVMNKENIPFATEDQRNDFNLTWERFMETAPLRTLVYEWDDVNGGLSGSYWAYYIELLKTGHSYDLIYSVDKGDFALDYDGWYDADNFESFLTKDFQDIPSFVSADYSDWGTLVNGMVYDETGKGVILIERDVKKLGDIKSLDTLMNDESVSIDFLEYDYELIMNALKKFLDA